MIWTETLADGKEEVRSAPVVLGTNPIGGGTVDLGGASCGALDGDGMDSG